MQGIARLLFACAFACAMLVNVSEPSARDLSQQLSSTKTAATIEAVFAVGVPGKANHDAVGMLIRGEASPLGLNLELGTSKGSAESAQAVCAGLAQFAVGQWDTFVTYLQDPAKNCLGKILRVKVPTYNYLLYVVARADAPFNSLDDMVDHAPKGKPVTIAAGRAGSGGQDTMAAIAKAFPEYRISLPYDGGEVAEGMVLSGQVMAYAIMDAPNSDTVRRLSEQVDSKTGKPAFKFIDIDLPSRFYREAIDANKERIYEEGDIPTTGWFTSDITTVTTPAALVVNKDFAYQQQSAFRAFSEAAKRAESAIKAATAPKN